MFSRLRVCRSSSVVGKQQDGAMESSQTKGNARPAHRVGRRRVWPRVGGSPASVPGAAPAEHLSEARNPRESPASWLPGQATEA